MEARELNEEIVSIPIKVCITIINLTELLNLEKFFITLV